MAVGVATAASCIGVLVLLGGSLDAGWVLAGFGSDVASGIATVWLALDCSALGSLDGSGLCTLSADVIHCYSGLVSGVKVDAIASGSTVHGSSVGLFLFSGWWVELVDSVLLSGSGAASDGSTGVLCLLS